MVILWVPLVGSSVNSAPVYRQHLFTRVKGRKALTDVLAIVQQCVGYDVTLVGIGPATGRREAE